MSTISFETCLRLSCQLLLCESIFVVFSPRRKRFLLRLMISLAFHFALVYGAHSMLKLIPTRLDSLSTILYCTLAFAATTVMIGVCFEVPKSKMIAAAVNGYSIQHITYTLVLFLRLALGREVYGGWSPLVIYLVFHTTPYLITCLLYFFLIEKPFRRRTEFKEYDLRIAIVMLMVIISNVILSEIRTEEMGQPINQFTTYIVCGLYAIITCSLALFLQYAIGIENKSTTDKNTMERMLELTHKQYELSKENIDMINMKCHDLRHQINAWKDGRLSQDSQAWAEELERSVSIYDSTFQSGSSALDVVLTEKSLKCARYKIEFGVIADGKSIHFLSPADTYSLFGNMIENAIERLLKEEENKRYITVNISRDGSMVFIHVENYCSGGLVFQEGLPVTDKGDKNYHGFGTKSIVYIAKKYGGDVVFKQTGEKFCVDIVFGDQ